MLFFCFIVDNQSFWRVAEIAQRGCKFNKRDIFKNAFAFLLRDARHATHDILLLRISAILPEAISDGGLTPTTDTDLLLATYRGGSHLTSDIHQSTENPDNKKLLQGRTAHDKSLPPLEFHLFPSLGCLYYFFHFFYRISCISRYLFNRLARF